MKLKQFNPQRGPNVMFSEGVLKLLNDSDDQSMLIMFREAVQNSWDARLPDDKGIHFNVRGYDLNDNNVSSFSKLFSDTVYGKHVLSNVKNNRNVLEISDTGTHGLTGPVGFHFKNNAEQQRYLKFIYDIGNSQEAEKAGGSYGFGKVSFYRLSKIGFNAIYTRIKTVDGFESRLIFKCINKTKKLDENNTGAFWWGKDVESGKESGAPSWVTPLLNDEADSVLSSLGSTPFKNDQTGTKILVFNPIFFNDKNKLDFFSARSWSVQLLARYAVHLYWAKWPIRDRGGINFSFVDDFEDGDGLIEMDNPNDISPYNDLIRCLDSCKKQSEPDSDIYLGRIESGNPRQHLGHVAAKVINTNSIDLRYARFWQDKNIQIALMRNVEFVLRYYDPEISFHLLEKDKHENTRIIGVFRTLDNMLVKRFNGDDDRIDLNEIYRMAEDPTHAQWISSNVSELGSWCVTFINQTIPKTQRFIRSIVKKFEPERKESPVDATIELMSLLGSHIGRISPGGGTSKVYPKSKQNGTSVSGGSGTLYSTSLPVIKMTDIHRVERNVGSSLSLTLAVSNISLSTSYSLFPVCTDEVGNFTISQDKRYNISLPVRIMNVDSDDSALENVTIHKNGTAEISFNNSECNIRVKLDVMSECNFMLKLN